MSRGLSRSPLVAFAATAAALGALQPARAEPPGHPAGLKRTFVSADACAQCHSQSRAGLSDGPSLPGLVRFDESPTWSGLDKHRRAFDALTGPRGKRMGALLRLDDVARETSCLACHATGFLTADPSAERELVLASRREGVSCAACHGSYQEWVGAHGLPGAPVRAWRALSAVDKSRKYGMTDLRDPTTRASLCASCHVGDAAAGKVVTHAMYAAGHPPLPGFEVATFLEAMPPHWSKPADVEAFRKDAGLRARNHVDLDEPAATRSAVVGGVVALRDAMRLIAARAEPDPSPLGREARLWPDYAQFDCYACHHELQSPGYKKWRQVRGYDHRVDGTVFPGAPGRPQFRPWTLALAGLALEQTGGSTRDAYRDSVRELYAALDARPFGEPARVARAAAGLEAWADGMLDALKGTRFDAGSPPRLLKALAATPAGDVPDYDSARQVAWAFRAIYGDWRPRPANDAEIAPLLADLGRALKLDPYESRAPRSRLVSAGDLSGDPLRDALLRLSEGEYKSSLASAADYDPKSFQAALKRLSDLLARAAATPPREPEAE